MEPWENPALTDIFAKTSHPEPLEAVYYWKKTKQVQISDMKFRKT